MATSRVPLRRRSSARTRLSAVSAPKGSANAKKNGCCPLPHNAVPKAPRPIVPAATASAALDGPGISQT
jgi:hypothetical protein